MACAARKSGLQTKLAEEAAFAKDFSGQPSLSVFALALLKLRRTCLAVSFLVGSAMRSPKGEAWWAHKGSNLGPLPCEGNALPLSYAPEKSAASKRPQKMA